MTDHVSAYATDYDATIRLYDALLPGLARSGASRELSLLEPPIHERRWHRPDCDKDEREVMAVWLAARVDEVAQGRLEPFTVRAIAAAAGYDPTLDAVADKHPPSGKRSARAKRSKKKEA